MNGETTNRQPGRPRQFESGSVIDRAVELFWRKGYTAATTRDLQHALNLGQSSIYNTFGSKAQLLELALDRYEVLVTESLLMPLQKSPHGLGAIEQFFKSLQSWITNGNHRGCLLTNIMAEDGGMNQSVKVRTRTYRGRLRKQLQHALERAVDSGEVSQNTDIVARSHLLVGLALGMNLAARGGASGREIGSMTAAVQAELASWRQQAI